MKKLIYLVAPMLIAGGAYAQSDKYINAMQARIAAIDTTHSIDGLKDLANAFERIADAEKNQWLPYYYAALANVNLGYMLGMEGGVGGKAAITDPIADKAEQLHARAIALTAENSETFILKKMIATLRMMADPMNRYMEYGAAAGEALAMAKKMNPENPRVYLLEGQDKFYTPEQFGGSKTEAKQLFEEAANKFKAFKPETAIHPTWGTGQLSYFLNQLK